MWPATITPCECTQAGWCERHHCWKSAAMFLQCRRKIKDFQAWEEGRGPCLQVPVTPPDPMATDSGSEGSPNTELVQPAGPNLAQRAMNFGRAVVRHVADGGQKVADKVYEARLAVCRECSLCDTERMICKHQSCGCFLNVKARWQSEHCPLNKWPAIQPETAEATETP